VAQEHPSNLASSLSWRPGQGKTAGAALAHGTLYGVERPQRAPFRFSSLRFRVPQTGIRGQKMNSKVITRNAKLIARYLSRSFVTSFLL
jgi:hypothetical protein